MGRRRGTARRGSGRVRIPHPTTMKTNARHKEPNHYSSSFHAYSADWIEGDWRKVYRY